MQLPRITYLSFHTTFAMSVCLNLHSAYVQTFAAFIVIAPVPYASLGEGRYVGLEPFSSYHTKVAHVRTGPY